MVDYLRQNAIEGPWDTSDYLLVCVGADAQAEIVVRAGGRLATRLNASWVVVHVSPEGTDETSLSEVRCVDDAFRLAERLGAETIRLTGARRRSAEVLRYARRENITQIVVSRARTGFFRRLFGRNFANEMVRLSTDVPVYVIGAPEAATPRLTAHRTARASTAGGPWSAWRPPSPPWASRSPSARR